MTINSTVLSGYHALKDLDYLISHQRILLVTDPNISKLPDAQQLTEQLRQASDSLTIIDNVPAEPADADVSDLLATLAGQSVDMVVGIGGGSVLDIAKLLSVLLDSNNALTLADLFAGAQPTSRLRSLLIPTTAGTGSEATPNSILAVPAKQTKVGIISNIMVPDYVALLPELTVSMPAKISASTGIDALCHLIECFTASIGNDVADNYALIGMRKLFNGIEAVMADPSDLEARLNMLWASYYGGACIYHSGTHLVHAMSYPLGGSYHIPHGVANAILLVPCFRHMAPQISDKLAQVYDLLDDADLSLNAREKADRLIDYLDDLVNRLGLPTHLSELDIKADDIPKLATAAINVKRLIAHMPCAITESELAAIYTNIA